MIFMPAVTQTANFHSDLNKEGVYGDAVLAAGQQKRDIVIAEVLPSTIHAHYLMDMAKLRG